MRPAELLVAAVARFLDCHGIRPGPVVVAVSGGPDSVALLHAFCARRAPGAGPLVIAHLNHQLRGAASEADEAFVRGLHGRLAAEGIAGLELRVERADVAAQARAAGGNLEAVARRVRYAWLAHVGQQAGASCVATGHTADDQAETVLHRLVRGTGLKGLAGIAARRPLAPGVEVIRPLLAVTRADVLAALQELGQAYCQDRSNADRRYTRNRIRHELLPYLAAHYNPAVVAVLGRLAEQAAEVYGDRQARAAALLAAAERPRAGPLLVFDRRRLAAAPRPLVREALRLAWAREGWPMGGMGFREWERLAAVARQEVPAVDLPGGVRARCRKRVVQLGPAL